MKRSFDILAAFAGLLMLLPLLALIATLVSLADGNTPWFRGVRVGRGGRRFRMVKFRTMIPDAWKSGVSSTGAADRRITRMGKLLRRAKLDELPQLWNVLIGDMSLVGPRPDQVDQRRFYAPGEERKLEAKPGLTGLAQISGRNGISWQERKRLDIVYVERQSFLLDLSILCKTIPYVFLRRNLNANSD